MALDAGLQAIEAAGLGAGAGDARRFGLADGLAVRAPGQPTLYVPYGHALARVLGLRGAVEVVAGGEASGMVAIAAAARMVSRGQADTVIAGAAQALQPAILDHAAAQGWSSPVPARPFDAGHNGFVPAEGAAYVVVEAEETALARGAWPAARIAGVGEIFDPSAEPLAVSEAPEAGRAMQAALAEGGYLQNQVDLVVSAADGRPAVDFAEGYGLRRTFGRHAYFAAVTAPAGTLGHSFAASGPLALVAALEAMAHQETFPIAGFETAEKDLELAYCHDARAERLDCVLVTSLAAGGTLVSLLLQR